MEQILQRYVQYSVLSKAFICIFKSHSNVYFLCISICDPFTFMHTYLTILSSRPMDIFKLTFFVSYSSSPLIINNNYDNLYGAVTRPYRYKGASQTAEATPSSSHKRRFFSSEFYKGSTLLRNAVNYFNYGP